MRRFAGLLSALALWALVAQPVLAAIGTPTSLSTNTGYGGSTTANALTTTVDAPVGSLIVVPSAIQGTTTITSVVDSQANCTTYTANASAQAGFRMAAYLCNTTTTDLAVGQTITTNFNSASGKTAETAFMLSGIATSSPSVNNTSGTGTTTGLAFTPVSITPTNGTDANGEFVGVCIWIASGSTADGYTEDTVTHSWTILPAGASGSGPFGSSTNVLAHCAYKKVADNSALTWAPTWNSTSRTWGYIVFGLKSAGSAVAACGVTTTGAGAC